MRNVWKRAGAVALSLLMAFSIAVTAEASSCPASADTVKKAYDGSKYDLKSVQQITDSWAGSLMGKADASKLNPTGGVSVQIVTGSDYDDVNDKIIKPIMNELVKAYLKKNASGAKPGLTAEDVQAIYYGKLKGDQTGDVTFKIQEEFSDAFTGSCYALVLRYTGLSSDADGVTAQYAKISTQGKVQAHFNGYSAFAIFVTTEESLQQIVNTYYHGVGSDGASAAPVATVNTNTTTSAPAPVVSAPAQSTTQPVASSSGATAVASSNPDIVTAQGPSTSSQNRAASSGSSSTATSSASTSSVSASSSAGCYPAYRGSDPSIVEALKSVGETNTSFRHRAQIAQANGITGYKGRQEQNDQLMRLIRQGQLKKA